MALPGTIAENLRDADPQASDERLWHAIGVAQADFVRELPDGLDAPVAQGGTNFSGGQRQRLAIARAPSCAGPISTSSTTRSPPSTTGRMRRCAMRSRTNSQVVAVLIIAQRVSTIREAAQIVVLKGRENRGCGHARDADGGLRGLSKHCRVTGKGRHSGWLASWNRGKRRMPQTRSARARVNTARRLWEVAAGQRWRLVVAAISTVPTSWVTLAAVSYSALLVDRLWESIQATFAAGKTYTLTCLTTEVARLSATGIWSLAWVFYVQRRRLSWQASPRETQPPAARAHRGQAGAVATLVL